MSYDEEIAMLKETIGLLTKLVTDVVSTLTQNWINQRKVNKNIVKVVKAISVRVGDSEASREEMRKMISEISKGMQLQEGTIKEIEGFTSRGTGMRAK